MMKIRNKYVDNINRFMELHGFKQKAIVKRTIFNKDKVSRILKEGSDPRISELEIVAQAFGKELDYFSSSVTLINTDKLSYKSPVPHFYMGDSNDERCEDAKIYATLAERIHYLVTIGTKNKSIQEDF